MAVARELGVSHKTVSRVTTEFIEQLRLLIATQEHVAVEGLGRFQLQKVVPRYAVALTDGTFQKGEKGKTHVLDPRLYFRVNFSQSIGLKKVIKDLNMEKYSVDESMGDQEQLEKKASEGCPECGKELKKYGSVLICPVHGSEPFEDSAGGT